MDQTQLQQNIAKYYAKLPSDLQQSFSNMTWMEDLKNISAKYSLNNEQIETLATETTLVLLGIVHLEDYVLTLKKDLKLSEETFNKILDDLDANILKETKDDLVKTFESNIEFLENENKEKEVIPTTNEKEITKINEDEVPLPPYAGKITNYELGIRNEKTISSKVEESSMQEGGIIKNNENYPVGDSTESRTTNEVPKKEEPTQNTPKNIFEEKLKNPTVSTQTVSDYSTKKPDPYREAF